MASTSAIFSDENLHRIVQKNGKIDGRRNYQSLLRPLSICEKAYTKQYITEMRTLAEELVNGTAPKATPHPQKVSIGSDNPMMVTLGEATIVFDPDHIK